MVIEVNGDMISQASTLSERAKVLSNTLLNGFFNQKIESIGDSWKICGSYYDSARVIMETILDCVFEAEKALNNAQGVAKAVE